MQKDKGYSCRKCGKRCLDLDKDMNSLNKRIWCNSCVDDLWNKGGRTNATK